MQIEVFSTPEEFVGFAKEAAQAIGANIYATADRTQPLKQIEPDELLEYQHFTCKIHIAYPEDFKEVAEKAANGLYKSDISKMLAVQFGASSDKQMEPHVCISSSNEIASKFGRAIKKILKTTTRTDVVLASTGQPVKGSKLYYTETAAQSGKRFTQALGGRIEFIPAPRESDS